MIEGESHFITKVVDSDLGALTMFVKQFMGEHRKGVFRPEAKDVMGKGSKNVCGEDKMVDKMTHSTSPILWFRGEDVWKVGWGGEVSQRGGNERWSDKSLLDENSQELCW
ncbi:hypothetical protein Tco_0088855 [Tanacetum coccineum]